MSSRLKLTALSLLALSALLFVYLGVADRDATLAIPALLIGGTIVTGWFVPALAGVLLVLFVPAGLFLVVVGSTNLDPASQVLLGVAWFAGIPLVSGVLLIAAAATDRRPR